MRRKSSPARPVLFIIFLMAASIHFMDVHVMDVHALDSNDTADASKRRQIVISLGETPGSIYISWSGTSEGPEFLRYAGSRALLKFAASQKAEKNRILDGELFRYSVEISELAAGREYFYEIGDGTEFSYSGRFEAPNPQETTQVLFLGDVQFENALSDYDKWEDMTENAEEGFPDLNLAIIAGDMVNSPLKEEQWNKFLDSCGIFEQLPVMTVSGNHEGVKSNHTYSKVFAVPQTGPGEEEFEDEFYYFDYGSCRFIMLDSTFFTDERKDELGGKRWNYLERSVEKWLEEALESCEKPWKIVTVHHPPYGLHDNDTVSPDIRKHWSPIMEKGGVDMVLCGHQHMYMRTKKINGIVYVMGNSGMKKSTWFKGINRPLYSRAIYGYGPTYQIITMDRNTLELISYNEKGLAVDETRIYRYPLLHIFEFFSSH